MSSSLVASLQAISDTLREVIEGQIGAPRKVLHGKFKFAELLGHPIEKQQRIASDGALGVNWFDLEVTDVRDNPATTFSAMGNRRIADVTIRLEFIRYVLHRSTIDDGVSIDNVIAFLGDLDDVSQALGMPGNLIQTSDGRATEIPSGCVSQLAMPATGRIQREWEQHLLRSEITITAIVEITQEV